MILLDSDVVIDIRRKHPPASKWFQSLAEYPALPGYVVFELLNGCENLQRSRELEEFVRPFSTVWLSSSGSAEALLRYPRLHLVHGLGILDALIAQTAIEAGATLATFNTKHFVAVEGLVVVEPYER